MSTQDTATHVYSNEIQDCMRKEIEAAKRLIDADDALIKNLREQIARLEAAVLRLLSVKEAPMCQCQNCGDNGCTCIFCTDGGPEGGTEYCSDACERAGESARRGAQS